MRQATRSGGGFVVLFAASGVLGLGVVLGMFADPDQTFAEHYDDDGTWLPGMLASYLLLGSALAFAGFAHALGRVAGPKGVGLTWSGAGTAAGLGLAAVAFATVPTSLWFSSLVDEAGVGGNPTVLQEGQAVLPQFGYVALMMGAMLPAAVFMIVAARVPGLLPRWLSIASYPLAALVAVSAVMFMPIFLFVGWVVAACVAHREVPTP